MTQDVLTPDQARQLLAGNDPIQQLESRFANTRYVWAGKSTKGADCSGYACDYLESRGVKNLGGRNTSDLLGLANVTYNGKQSLQPGDVVVRRSKGPSGRHVAVYTGNDFTEFRSRGQTGPRRTNTDSWLKNGEVLAVIRPGGQAQAQQPESLTPDQARAMLQEKQTLTPDEARQLITAPPQSPQDARTARPGVSPTHNTPQTKQAAKLLSRYEAVNRKIDSLQSEIDASRGAVFGAALGGASLPKAAQLKKLKEERDALRKHPLIAAKNLVDLGIMSTKWSAQDLEVKPAFDPLASSGYGFQTEDIEQSFNRAVQPRNYNEWRQRNYNAMASIPLVGKVVVGMGDWMVDIQDKFLAGEPKKAMESLSTGFFGTLKDADIEAALSPSSNMAWDDRVLTLVGALGTAAGMVAPVHGGLPAKKKALVEKVGAEAAEAIIKEAEGLATRADESAPPVSQVAEGPKVSTEPSIKTKAQEPGASNAVQKQKPAQNNIAKSREAPPTPGVIPKPRGLSQLQRTHVERIIEASGTKGDLLETHPTLFTRGHDSRNMGQDVFYGGKVVLAKNYPPGLNGVALHEAAHALDRALDDRPHNAKDVLWDMAERGDGGYFDRGFKYGDNGKGRPYEIGFGNYMDAGELFTRAYEVLVIDPDFARARPDIFKIVNNAARAHNFPTIEEARALRSAHDAVKPTMAGQGASKPAATTGKVQAVQEEVAKPTVESTGPKEPWQMTRGEYDAFLKDKLAKQIDEYNKAGGRGLNVPGVRLGTVAERIKLGEAAGYKLPEQSDALMREDWHKLNVKAAISEGKPVPPEVLADYPDLAKKYEGPKVSTEPRPTSRDTTSKVSQEGGATPPASTKFSNQAKVEVTIEGKKLTPGQIDNIGNAPKASWLDERISELESKPKKTLGKNRQRGASNIGPEEIELLVLKTARLIRDGVMTAAEVAKELGVTVGKATGLLKQADKFLRDNTHYGSYKSIEGLDPAVQNTVRRILIDSQKDVMNLESARKRGIEEVTGMTTAELGEAAKNGLSVEQISGARHAMNELLKDPTPENVEAASKIARVVYPELTKAGRVLREAQETPEQVYSFGRLLQQADEVAKKYGQETPKAVAENLASYSSEMQSLRSELDAALEAARMERETSAGLQSKLDSMGKQKQSREYVERLRKSKDDAVARIKARLVTATAGASPFHLLDAEMVADVATVAKYYIHKGVYDISRLRARLKKEIPNASDDLILAGIDNASESASRAASPGSKQFGSYDVLVRGKSGAQGPDIASMRDRLKDLRIRIASEISKMEYQMASPAKKAGIVTRGVADNVWEFFRTVKASIDNSFAGVQGWFFNMGDLILSPGAVGKNFGAGFGSFFSEAKFNKLITDIQTHPLYNEWVADGGRLDAPGAMEMFQSHILLNEKWSKYNPFRSSDRAWQASSAQMKFNKYIEGRKSFDKMKLTDAEMRDARQALTNTIETVTGQKRFGTTDKGFNTVMSKALFSLRNLVGQVQTLNPVYLSRLPKGTRAYMIVRAGKAYGTLAVLYGVVKGAKAAGADVDLSLDLDDKNFGMFRAGNRVFDLTGGRASIAKNSVKFFRALAQGKAPEAGRIFGSFFIQRAHPAIGAAYTAKTGKNIATGQEQGNLESITPMAIQDIIDASKENGVAVGWLLALPSFVGLNTRERLENEPDHPAKEKTATGTATVPLPGGSGGDYSTVKTPGS